jgi:hypothetical protein
MLEKYSARTYIRERHEIEWITLVMRRDRSTFFQRRTVVDSVMM